MKPLRLVLAREIQSLWNESVLNRYLGWFRIGPWRPTDDKVGVLRHDSLGMFLYNQRALTFAVASFLLVSIGVVQFAVPLGVPDRDALYMLIGVWVVGFVLTLILYPSFQKQLHVWAKSREPIPLPAMFDVYFVLDSALLISAITLGARFGYAVDMLAFLVAANTVVYGAYVLGADAVELGRVLLLAVLILLTLLVMIALVRADFKPTWFRQVMNVAALVGAIMVTLFSTGVIARIKRNEQRRVTHRLTLLGKYEQMLGMAAIPSSLDDEPSGDQAFRDVLRQVLLDLCGHLDTFWYRSACLWRAEYHSDRQSVYFPTISVGVPEVRAYRDGIVTSAEAVVTDEVVILRSLEGQAQSIDKFRWRFRFDQNIPAAYVPLRRNGQDFGAMVIYGTEAGPGVSRQDEAFLKTLVVRKRAIGTARMLFPGHDETKREAGRARRVGRSRPEQEFASRRRQTGTTDSASRRWRVVHRDRCKTGLQPELRKPLEGTF